MTGGYGGVAGLWCVGQNPISRPVFHSKQISVKLINSLIFFSGNPTVYEINSKSRKKFTDPFFCHGIVR